MFLYLVIILQPSERTRGSVFSERFIDFKESLKSSTSFHKVLLKQMPDQMRVDFLLPETHSDW